MFALFIRFVFLLFRSVTLGNALPNYTRYWSPATGLYAGRGGVESMGRKFKLADDE